tara:strand:- start:334 stop:702 length:369 start_codon:yes stop_codon:yes gene_type:complete
MQLLKHSDIFGLISAISCAIHCSLTPLLFIIPFWWSGLNILFVIFSFFAVYGAVKNSSSKIVKPLLWIGFVFFLFMILNEELGLLHLPELLTYTAATNLAILHIYNLKYCQCKDDQCCIHKN